ncbi:MAG: immunoglobulin domain-containing protein [Verrucomicrobia bacterium]|nr:immunoglobulin domain-containing protein [Verrucomicrobiota bacterium]
MKPTRLTPLLLAAFLHIAPVASRVTQSVPTFSTSPTVVVLKWIVGALALTGAYHTVSAATGLVSASTVSGTTGKRLTYQIKITGREVGLPDSWLVVDQLFNRPGTVTEGLPPGLSFSLNTMILSGTPTQDGTFDVDFTAFEHRNGGGGALSFTLTFVIAPGAAAPVIAGQPVDSTIHLGEPLTLTMAATGGNLAYQWKHDGADVPGANSASLNLTAVSASDAGDYVAVVTNPFGSATSAVAKVVVVPLVIGVSLQNDGSAVLNLQTIPGRSYVIEAADVVNPPTWNVVGEIVASGNADTFTDSTAQAAQRFWRYHAAP